MSSNTDNQKRGRKNSDRTENELNEKWKQITQQVEIKSEQIKDDSSAIIEQMDKSIYEKQQNNNILIQQNELKHIQEFVNLDKNPKKRNQSPSVKKSRILFPSLFKSSQKNQRKSQLKNLKENEDKHRLHLNNIINQKSKLQTGQNEELQDQESLKVNLKNLQNFVELEGENKSLLEYRQHKYTNSEESDQISRINQQNEEENKNITEIEYNSTVGNQVLTTGQQTIKNTNNLFSNTQIGAESDNFFQLQFESLRANRKTQQHVKKTKKNKKTELQNESQELIKQKNTLGFFSKFLPNWQNKKKEKAQKELMQKNSFDQLNDDTLQIHQHNYIRNDHNQFKIIDNYIVEGEEINFKNNISNQDDNFSTKLLVDQASQIGQFTNQKECKNEEIQIKKKNFEDDDFDMQYKGFGKILYNSSDSEDEPQKDKKFFIQNREQDDVQSRFSLVAMRKQKQFTNFGGTFQQEFTENNDENKRGIQDRLQSQNILIGSSNSNNQIQKENYERKVSNITNIKSQNSYILSDQRILKQEKQAIFQGIHQNKMSSEYYDELQNDGDLPINLDFLNYQEQQIVDSLFPIKKKSDNSNNSVIKSNNQISLSKSNFDSEVAFNNSLPINPLEQQQVLKQFTDKQLNEMHLQVQEQIFFQFQGIKVQQQGTSISIFNIWDAQHKKSLIKTLNDNQIVPTRVIYLQENGEVILNMLSFEETSQAIKFFIDNKVKIISNQLIEEVTVNKNARLSTNLINIQQENHEAEERDQVYEISLNKKVKLQVENSDSYKNSSDLKSHDKCMIQSVNSIYSNQMQMKNQLFDSGTFDEKYRFIQNKNDHVDPGQRLSQQNVKQSSFYPFGLFESHAINQKVQRTISQQGIQLDNNFQVKNGDFSEKNQSYFDFVKAKFQQERVNRVNNENNQYNDEEMRKQEFDQNFQNNSFDPRGLFQNMTSNYANYEGLMSQSQMNFVYENSLDPKTCQKLGALQSFAETKAKKNFGNKSADYQQSSQLESQIDSESSEKFSYIQPLYQQMDSFIANQMHNIPNLEAQKQRFDGNDMFSLGPEHKQNMNFAQQQNWKHESMYPGMQQNQQNNIPIFQNQLYYQKQLGSQEDSSDYEQQMMNYYMKQYGKSISEKQKQFLMQLQFQYFDVNQQQIFQKSQINAQMQQQQQQQNLARLEIEQQNQFNKLNQKQINQQPLIHAETSKHTELQTHQSKDQEADLLKKNYGKKTEEKQKNRSLSPSQQKKPAPSNYKKKVYVGPKQNKIDFERILNADLNNDQEVKQQTTLMIRNIPIKFNQQDMMQLIDKNFKGQYDYFYLPIDLKTQCGMGFAFINMLHSIFILEFYLEFNCVKWSEKIEKCNSNKHSQITYANVQGINDIKAELLDKNIMKKADGQNKPQFFEDLQIDQSKINEIKYRFQYDRNSIMLAYQKLRDFDEYNKNDNQKQKQVKNEKINEEEQKSESDFTQSDTHQVQKKQQKEQVQKNQKISNEQIEDYQEQKYYGQKSFNNRQQLQNPKFMHQQHNFNREITFQQSHFRNKSAYKNHAVNDIQYTGKQMQQMKYEDKNKGKHIQSYQQILIQKTSSKYSQPQIQEYKAQNMGRMVKGKNYFYNPLFQTKKYRENIIEFQKVSQLQVLDNDGNQLQLTPTFAQYKNQGSIQQQLADVFKKQNQYLTQINESSKISTGITPMQALRQPSSLMDTIYNMGKYF